MSRADKRHPIVQLVIDWLKGPKTKIGVGFEEWKFLVSCAGRLIIEEFLRKGGKVNDRDIDEYCRVILSYISFEYIEKEDLQPVAYSLMTLLLAEREKRYKYKKRLLLKSIQVFWEEPNHTYFAGFKDAWIADLDQVVDFVLHYAAKIESHSISSAPAGVSVFANGYDISIDVRGWLRYSRTIGVHISTSNYPRLISLNSNDAEIMTVSQMYNSTGMIKNVMSHREIFFSIFPIGSRLYKAGDDLYVRVLFKYEDRIIIETIDPLYYHIIDEIKLQSYYDLKDIIRNGDILPAKVIRDNNQMSLWIDEQLILEALSILPKNQYESTSQDSTGKDLKDVYWINHIRQMLFERVLASPSQDENNKDMYERRRLLCLFHFIQKLSNTYLKTERRLEERCQLLSLNYFISSLLSDSNNMELFRAELAMQCNIVTFLKNKKNYITPEVIRRKNKKLLEGNIEIDKILRNYNEYQMPIQELPVNRKAKELVCLLNEFYYLNLSDDESHKSVLWQKIADFLNAGDCVK